MKKFAIMFLIVVCNCEQAPVSIEENTNFNNFVVEKKINKYSLTCQDGRGNYICFGLTLSGTPVKFECYTKFTEYNCYYM